MGLFPEFGKHLQGRFAVGGDKVRIEVFDSLSRWEELQQEGSEGVGRTSFGSRERKGGETASSEA